MGFSPLQMNSGSNIDYGNDSDKISQKKRFLSVTGFTLSELLLAAAILVFVLAGLLALFLNCLVLNEANRNLTVATSHAQYVMEEIKNTPFSSISTNYNGICLDNTAISSRGLNALNNESICISVNGTDMLDVVVTVNWRDRRIRDRNTNLETLITEQ